MRTMKIENPKSRLDIQIRGNNSVFDVGGGNNPYNRANIVVDNYLCDNAHRSGGVKIFKNQKLVVADGTALPFKDKVFDYLFCSHVLERVTDLSLFRMNFPGWGTAVISKLHH